jgi:hypothetical protein
MWRGRARTVAAGSIPVLNRPIASGAAPDLRAVVPGRPRARSHDAVQGWWALSSEYPRLLRMRSIRPHPRSTPSIRGADHAADGHRPGQYGAIEPSALARCIVRQCENPPDDCFAKTAYGIEGWREGISMGINGILVRNLLIAAISFRLIRMAMTRLARDTRRSRVPFQEVLRIGGKLKYRL